MGGWNMFIAPVSGEALNFYLGLEKCFKVSPTCVFKVGGTTPNRSHSSQTFPVPRLSIQTALRHNVRQ